jgi:hypothetical protein
VPPNFTASRCVATQPKKKNWNAATMPWMARSFLRCGWRSVYTHKKIFRTTQSGPNDRIRKASNFGRTTQIVSYNRKITFYVNIPLCWCFACVTIFEIF